MKRMNHYHGSDGVWMPVPTRITGTDDVPPLPQPEKQRATEKVLLEFAELYSSRLGMDRREFLKTA